MRQYHIDEKTKLFNRKYIQEYCVMRQTYRNLYYEKLCGGVSDTQRLRELEIALEIPTLVELREWAKLKAKKRPSSSWFGGWFSVSGTDDSGATAHALDEADRRRIQSIIEDSDSIMHSTNKPGVVRYLLEVKLPLFEIQLTNLLKFELHQTEVEFKSIPGSSSTLLKMSCNSLKMENLKHAKQIMSSNNAKSGKFFQFQFQTNPFDSDCKKVHALVNKNLNMDVYKDMDVYLTHPVNYKISHSHYILCI